MPNLPYAIQDFIEPRTGPGRRERTRFGQTLAAYQLGQEVIRSVQAAQKWYIGRNRFTVIVKSDDSFYADVQDWLLTLISPVNRKSVVARSRLSVRQILDDDVEERPRPSLHVAYNDAQTQDVVIDGYRIKISVRRAGEEVTSTHSVAARSQPDELRFEATSEAAQQAVIGKLQQVLHSRGKKRDPSLYMLSSYGNWQQRSDIPRRRLETVVLKPGQPERIMADLSAFLASEEAYGRIGIPWHRGYLLYGPPGTGKTSFVKALATHFGLDLWYAPLRDIKQDTNLLTLFSDVRPRSALLLEDVDSFRPARTDGDDGYGTSASGFINALDGVSTPHGLITIMTSNKPELLDETVIRPGRVDCKEEFTNLDGDRVGRLFEVVYGRRPQTSLEQSTVGMSPATLMEVFKRCMFDPEAAERALCALPARNGERVS